MRFYPRRSGSRRLVPAALVASLLALSAAVGAAGAQGDGVGSSFETVCGQAPGTVASSPCDTEESPEPKDGAEVGWTRVAGARFPESSVPGGSPTRVSDD